MEKRKKEFLSEEGLIYDLEFSIQDCVSFFRTKNRLNFDFTAKRFLRIYGKIKGDNRMLNKQRL